MVIRRWSLVVLMSLAVFCSAKAGEMGTEVTNEEQPISTASKWLDDYPKHIGLTWGVEAQVVGNYLWRGLYVGGLGLQANANVGYGGAFVEAWANVGADSWHFQRLNPELDISIGFQRWGLKLVCIHMFYFDGIENMTSEMRLGYKVSSKLPLSFMWCTRFWGKDSYTLDDGVARRAYSTYIELGYDFSLPWQLTLQTRLGVTPWKSMYTGFKGNFAVVNIDLVLRREWKLTDYCRLQTHAQLMFRPWQVDKNNIKWDVKNPWDQRLNFSMGVGVIF